MECYWYGEWEWVLDVYVVVFRGIELGVEEGCKVYGGYFGW